MNAVLNHIKGIQITFGHLFKGRFLVYFIPGIVLTIIFYGVQAYAEKVQDSLMLTSDYNWIEWVYGWLNAGIEKAFSIIGFILEQLYIFLVLTALSPFVTLLSEKLDTKETGQKFEFGVMRFINDLIRMIFLVIIAVLMELAFLFVYWTISFALGLDALDPVMYFLIAAFFFGFAMYDYTLERYGINLFGTLTFAFENILTVLLTGSLFLGLYSIPYAGIPISPVITAMVSTIVYLYITNKLPADKPK